MRARSKITSAVFGVAALAAVTLPAVTAASPALAGSCGEAGKTTDKIVVYNCGSGGVEVILQNEPNLYGRFAAWEWGHSGTAQNSKTDWYGPGEDTSHWVFNMNYPDVCGQFMEYSHGTWTLIGKVTCATHS